MAAATFEADLRAAREAADVSVDAIQLETRIPADVITRLEAGSLLDDPSFNEVYIRALLRSYATAVGIAPGAVLDAYTAAKEGAYRGQLRPDYQPPEPVAPPLNAEGPEAEPDSVPEGGGDRVVPEAIEPKPVEPKPVEPKPVEPKPAPPPVSAPAPAVAALSRAPAPPAQSRPPDAPNEHFQKRRVASAASMKTPRSFDRSWGVILGVTAVVVMATVAVLWLLFRTEAPEPDELDQVAVADSTDGLASDSLFADTLAADATATDAGAGSGPPLQLPIRVTVRAKGDGLQNFRVTEEPDSRRPYWMEPGTEQTFESSQGLILWGEEADGMNPEEVTLVWQGIEWAPRAGQVVRITPQNGQRMLDSLNAAR